MKWMLLLTMFIARTALACSCAGPVDVKIGLKCSDAYFLGLVIEGNERTQETGTLRTRGTEGTTKVAVVEGFKGVESGSVVMVDGYDGGCSKILVTGGLYVIQAWYRDGALHTNLCSQTIEASQLGKALHLLRRWAWWWRLPFQRCR